MILQLNPPLPVNTTSKGKGLAHLVIDYGIEHHLYWVIFCDNGEIWTLSNTEIRADSNESWGREIKKEPRKCYFNPAPFDNYVPRKHSDLCANCGCTYEDHVPDYACLIKEENSKKEETKCDHDWRVIKDGYGAQQCTKCYDIMSANGSYHKCLK